MTHIRADPGPVSACPTTARFVRPTAAETAGGVIFK